MKRIHYFEKFDEKDKIACYEFQGEDGTYLVSLLKRDRFVVYGPVKGTFFSYENITEENPQLYSLSNGKFIEWFKKLVEESF